MNITKLVLLLALASAAFSQPANVAFPGKVTAKTPGGTIPVWKRYQITVDATNWLVNGVAAPAGEGHVSAKAAATSQVINLFQLPAGGIVEGFNIRRAAACTGATTAQLTEVGDACGSNSFSLASPYNLHTAPTNTDMKNLATTRRCTIVAHYVYLTFATTGANISDLASCAIDVSVKWSVLP